jgi:uncharacterized protein
MKLEVEYMVETLSNVLRPLIAKGSFELYEIDLTEKIGFFIEKIVYDDVSRNLIIIAPDRPEKSSIIGKGGWVVGRLREELGVNNIHVDAYSDLIIRIYRMELAMKKLEKILTSIENTSQPLKNLQDILMLRMNNLDTFDFLKEFSMELSNFKSEDYNVPINEKYNAVVALSGGVDSSFSLIIAKLMGFNPLAVTVNPGNIILPSYFRNNVESLSKSLNVPHEYVDVNMDSVVDQALKGKLHPCGRCSKIIETALLEYSKKIEIPFLIFGDFLATGSQSIVSVDGLWRINLPAMLSATKGETKSLSKYFNIESRGGYGCPLINEVHIAHPHMRRFSIQRILRETRAGVLEPGQALDLIIKTL